MAAKDYATRPITRVVTLTNANEQYIADFSDVTDQIKKIEFQCRTSVAIRYAFEAGKVAIPTNPYMTLKADYSYGQDGLMWNKPKIYFASGSAGVVVEVTAWV